MASAGTIRVLKIETLPENAGSEVAVTVQISGLDPSFELVMRVPNLKDPAKALETTRSRLLAMGESIVSAAGRPLTM